jgi:hypothetical protein
VVCVGPKQSRLRASLLRLRLSEVFNDGRNCQDNEVGHLHLRVFEEDQFFLLPSGFYFHCFDGESSTTEAFKIQADEGVGAIIAQVL